MKWYHEWIAWILYGLSKVKLAPRPSYTTCIGDWITCGYCSCNNGFFKYPLYKKAKEFEARCEARAKERECK